MQRLAVLLAVLYLTAISLSAQIPKFGQLGAFSHAEDSPDANMNNELFYNSPHSPEPQMSEPAGTVSVEQLLHPISRKGEKLLKQAQNLAALGDHGKAIEELKLALKERSAIPYAHSLLGSEYLRVNQIPAAIEALQHAIELLPRTAINHANLGYALFLMGSDERAEAEVRRALELDRNNAKTRQVLSLITHAAGNGQ
jgi:tetratricopeptide (TPR) repeat protein